MYSVAGISRQGFRKCVALKAKYKVVESQTIELVVQKRLRHKKMGSRSLFYACKIETMGINKFERLMAQNGLTILPKRKWIRTTTGLYEDSDVNLINGLEISNMNEVVVGDITYLILDRTTYYVFTLKDAYSKAIVGLFGSERMLAADAQMALKQLIRLRGKSEMNGLIHHTDAGSQYKSKLYKTTLAKCKIKMSISENCLQNGIAEQLNGILKNDYLEFEMIKNVKQLNRLLTKIKHLINNEKPVAELKYKTPMEFEKWIKSIPAAQRPKMKLFDFHKVESIGGAL